MLRYLRGVKYNISNHCTVWERVFLIASLVGSPLSLLHAPCTYAIGAAPERSGVPNLDYMIVRVIDRYHVLYLRWFNRAGVPDVTMLAGRGHLPLTTRYRILRPLLYTRGKKKRNM